MSSILGRREGCRRRDKWIQFPLRLIAPARREGGIGVCACVWSSDVTWRRARATIRDDNISADAARQARRGAVGGLPGAGACQLTTITHAMRAPLRSRAINLSHTATQRVARSDISPLNLSPEITAADISNLFRGL